MNPRLIATAAVAMAIGGLVGYKVAERKLMREFEERLDRETDALRRMHKTDYKSPEDMVEQLHGEAVEAVREYQAEGGTVMGTPVHVVTSPVAYDKIRPSTVKVNRDEPEEEVVRRRVFEPDEEHGPIFIISAEENAEGSYEDATLTYYAQDGVITFANDEVMEDREKFIGGTDVAALENFGGISGDDNVVYVRNEVLLMDYEILRHPGSYVKEVLDQEYVPPTERPSQRMR